MLSFSQGGIYMANLLIVEDDKSTNDAICEYLKPAGHRPIPAYDGAEALEIFCRAPIDLIVLDIMLPHISGLSVLQEIRKTSSVPILMLTAMRMITLQSLFLWCCWGEGSRHCSAGAGKCSPLI